MIYKVLESRRNEMGVNYKIINIISPPHNQNGLIATHALGLMMYAYTRLVVTKQRVLNKLSKHGVTANHVPGWMSRHTAITERACYFNLKMGHSISNYPED